MGIHVLSDQLIAQIAAGEVVERPASVVKELVENALDAGAQTVHVAVSGGGRKRIRVSDDGTGIAGDQVELALFRHATSKLETIDDLSAIRTLGFRGEALSSIASVSQLTLTSRHREEPVGTQLRVNGGDLIERQAVGAPAGTVIDVENLFYNTPARLKFQKKESTEKRHIAALITRYAMAYPEVRFVLEQDGREVFRSSGRGGLADVVAKAVGLDQFKQMVEVYAEEPTREGRPAVIVQGYTSMPDYNRADRTHITLFVNGRWIQDSSLTYAVVQAYHTLLMNGRYPVAVLMIDVEPHEVDVNVHPTKAEVRFRDANTVFSVVQRAVRQAVVRFSETPNVRRGQYAGYATGGGTPAWHDNGHRGTERAQMSLDEIGAESSDSAEADDPTAIPVGPGAPRKPRTLPVLRVVGQVAAMYIVAEGPAGMYLVDQHAAHERILYEQFMEAHQKKDVMVQHTLGQTIELAPGDARLLEEKLVVLQGVGFALEPFGPNTFVVRTVPAMLADADPVEVLSAVLDDLELEKQPGQRAIEEKIIRYVCRYGAVKAGQVLRQEQMQDLIRQLERCESPHTCPHGRPTMLHMSGEQLAREFGR